MTHLNALKLAIIVKYFWLKLDVENYDQNVSSYLNYSEIQTFVSLYWNLTDLIKFPLFSVFVLYIWFCWILTVFGFSSFSLEFSWIGNSMCYNCSFQNFTFDIAQKRMIFGKENRRIPLIRNFINLLQTTSLKWKLFRLCFRLRKPYTMNKQSRWKHSKYFTKIFHQHWNDTQTHKHTLTHSPTKVQDGKCVCVSKYSILYLACRNASNACKTVENSAQRTAYIIYDDNFSH